MKDLNHIYSLVGPLQEWSLTKQLSVRTRLCERSKLFWQALSKYFLNAKRRRHKSKCIDLQKFYQINQFSYAYNYDKKQQEPFWQEVLMAAKLMYMCRYSLFFISTRQPNEIRENKAFIFV